MSNVSNISYRYHLLSIFQLKSTYATISLNLFINSEAFAIYKAHHPTNYTYIQYICTGLTYHYAIAKIDQKEIGALPITVLMIVKPPFTSLIECISVIDYTSKKNSLRVIL